MIVCYGIDDWYSYLNGTTVNVNGKTYIQKKWSCLFTFSSNNNIFQHNWAPSHYAWAGTHFFNVEFPYRLMSRRGSVGWTSSFGRFVIFYLVRLHQGQNLCNKTKKPPWISEKNDDCSATISLGIYTDVGNPCVNRWLNYF